MIGQAFAKSRWNTHWRRENKEYPFWWIRWLIRIQAGKAIGWALLHYGSKSWLTRSQLEYRMKGSKEKNTIWVLDIYSHLLIYGRQRSAHVGLLETDATQAIHLVNWNIKWRGRREKIPLIALNLQCFHDGDISSPYISVVGKRQIDGDSLEFRITGTSRNYPWVDWYTAESD